MFYFFFFFPYLQLCVCKRERKLLKNKLGIVLTSTYSHTLIPECFFKAPSTRDKWESMF